MELFLSYTFPNTFLTQSSASRLLESWQPRPSSQSTPSSHVHRHPAHRQCPHHLPLVQCRPQRCVELCDSRASAVLIDILYTELAICPNTSELHIYRKTGSDWKLIHVLAEVRMAIMDMDIPMKHANQPCSTTRSSQASNGARGLTGVLLTFPCYSLLHAVHVTEACWTIPIASSPARRTGTPTSGPSTPQATSGLLLWSCCASIARPRLSAGLPTSPSSP